MAISKIITSSLTDDAVTSAKIGDDAVTSAKIGTDQVGADALSSSAISGAVDIPANSVGESELSVDYTAQSVPHIIPGVLYPAVAGKLLDGTTSHSGNYGTPQTQSGGDGRSYYYTDIKGSKPIKDPRIGGHFGSQRHDTTSLQKLEQETATHGEDVFSVDGREWMRAVNVSSTALIAYYEAQGTYVQTSQNDFIEVVGYFIDANISTYTFNGNACRITVNGGSEVGTSYGSASVTTPLLSRYVDASSIVNLSVGATLGINTLKIRCHSSGFKVFNIELIAQDTSNRNNIQIPSQNVVSYGKKFNVSAEGSSGHHYDPFNGFTSGSSVSSYVDTATSLGVENWKHSSTYYRPYNGGRVVKWVDSSGVIKTSVTLMPPNAQNFGGTAITPKANASVANDTYLPTFSGAIDDSLSEVAKHYISEEFGNGSANQGSNPSANPSYQDASMLGGSSGDIAYVMDDGLTSLSANAVTKASSTPTMPGYINIGSGDNVYTTFIGTGVTLGITNYAGTATHIHKVAFNLPYGTHILRVYNTGGTVKYVIDGVEVQSSFETYWAPFEFTFYQPKRPPIPEDACVLADYMLMADYVPRTATGSGANISKGIRRVVSRDIFYDSPNAWNANSFNVDLNYVPTGMKVYAADASAGDIKIKLPVFGTKFEIGTYDARLDLFVDNSAIAHADVGSGATAFVRQTGDTTLANHVFEGRNNATNNGNSSQFDIATPIHTSSHYQAFETPYLHELVGGDRNMEQTNLVCSPDGKTWDEVTRDVSYIGNQALSLSRDGGDLASGTQYVWDYTRGKVSHGRTYFTKDWIIGYDRIICLKDGQYSVDFTVFSNADNNRATMFVFYNGSSDALAGAKSSTSSGEKTQASGKISRYFERGDFLGFTYYANTSYGSSANSANSALLQINKV